MKQAQQIPRPALVWIIVSQVLLVAPHVPRIPLWVLAVYAAAFVWRIQIYRGVWSYPARWLKLILIVTAGAGIALSFGTLIGMEPTVALLLTAFALKLTEMASRKDAYVVIFLGFFVCLTEFLFSQDLLIVVYGALTIWVLTTALIAVHRPPGLGGQGSIVRQAGVMLLQSVPLMLVLFFLFPRIGPLWNVPIKSQAGKSGVSDFMRPGDISDLTLSDEVAFRAEFSGAIPPASSLYWRGLVMSRLEEGAWRTLSYFEVPATERRPEPVDTGGLATLDYSVIIEPTQQNWLYALRFAKPRQGGILELSDYRLYTPAVIENERLYRVRSWPEATLETTLSDWRRRIETSLPGTANPRARELAGEWLAEAGSPEAMVDRVLAHFRNQPFVYTLQPPLLGEDPVDAFLFDTRRGFCEHYAYAFAVLMRAAGIPARVVAGYQGGEVNPVNRTVIVHQFDAHAWNEVWLEGQGWVRVDPTAAVAPSRIEYGLEEAMRAEGSFLSNTPLSPLRYRGIGWLNAMRLRYDALTYQWQSWVVGYDQQKQIEVLREAFGAIDAKRFVAVLLGSWLVVLLIVAGSLFWRGRRQHEDPVLRQYQRFCARLAAAGVPRAPDEPPAAYASRAAAALPAQAAHIHRVSELFLEAAYQPVSPDRRRFILHELQRSLHGFSFRRA